MLTVAAALDAALREIDATADMDTASFDTMSASCLRSLLVGMVEQAREIRAGLLSGIAR
ncbi:hypothetical protein [Muricoccus aerilatus]|uniref:hypothetical protein n=1 Tax=Muricoccus aerilatus TaxID=452982 RepID=UPI000AB1041E|nr:hypothetical protein [Roseomonas aerilata]